MADSKIIPFSPFRADLSVSLTKRGKAILAAADIGDRVQALTSLEAFFIIRELGPTHAGPLMPHVTAAQMQAFVDIDCWDGDTFDIEELDSWLALCAEEGGDCLLRAFAGLDTEIQILFLARSFAIRDYHEDAYPELSDDVPHMITPDSFFLLEAPEAEKRNLHPFLLVELLYREDLHEAYKLLMAAQWESPTPLTELAYHFRGGRMDELGFPPPEEAFSLFSHPPATPPPRHLVDSGGESFTLPALYAQPLIQDCLLVTAIARIRDPVTLAAIEAELAYLVNAALVAFRERPRDLDHVTAIAERARDTISLGMESLLASVDSSAIYPDEAMRLLFTWPLNHLFRHGHKLVVELRRHGLALAADPVVAHWLDKEDIEGDDYSLDRRDRLFLKALIADRPQYAGFDPLKPEKIKAFGSLAEITVARERVEALKDRVA